MDSVLEFLLEDVFGVTANGILEVYSIGGGPYLRLVLAGLSNIVYSANFNALLAIVALSGFLVLLAQGAVNPKKFNYMWLFMLAAIYYGAILPRTDVMVVDSVLDGYSEPVADVPLIVALPAAFFSHVSLWFTRQVETQFKLPDQISYSNTGFLLGHELVADLKTMRFPDQRVAENYAEFWRTCVFYDIALERYRWEQVVEASEKGGQALIDFLSDHASQARHFAYKTATGDSQLYVCKTGWDGVMAADLRQQMIAMYKTKHYKIIPWNINQFDEQEVDADVGDTIGSYAAAMPAALSYYTNISQSAAETANTAILGNSMREGLGYIAGKTDVAAATQDYALSKAQLERNNSFAVMGRVASKFLPILRNVFEALAYAVAPIVILMMVLPVAGKVIMGYLKVLAWINLWNPFYALLHCIMNFYSSGVVRGMTTTVDNGGSIINSLSFLNYTELSQTMSEHSLLAGYLSLSVPMMAWMVVSMSGAMMAGLAARTMQGYDGSVQRASTEITSGNINMGNVMYGNSRIEQDQLAPTTDSHRVGAFDPTTGMERTMDAAGRQFSTQPRSDYVSKVNLDDSVSRVAKENVTEATSRVSETSAQVQESASALRTELNSFAKKSSEQDIHTDGHAASETGAFNTAAQNVNSGLRSFAQSMGWSEQKQDAFVSAKGIETAMGVDLPGFKFGGKGSATWSDHESKMSSEDKQKMDQYLTSQTYTDGLAQTAQGMHTEMGGHISSAGTETVNSSSSALNSLKAATESHGEAVQHLNQAQYVQENSSSIAASIKTEYDDEINQFAASRDQNPMSRNMLDGIRSRAAQGDEAAQSALADIQDDFVRSKLGEATFNYKESAQQIESDGQAAIATQLDGGNQAVENHHRGAGVGGDSFGQKQQEIREKVEIVGAVAGERIENPEAGESRLPPKSVERVLDEAAIGAGASRETPKN